MTEATTPATDADLTALKAAAEAACAAQDRLDAAGEPCCDGECARPGACRDPRRDIRAFQEAADPATILGLLARLDAAERDRREIADALTALLNNAEARAERLEAVLEAEREERRAERAVREAGDALVRAEARDDELAYAQAVKQHDAALQAHDLMYNRAEAARAALAQLVAAAVRDPTPEGV